MFANRKLQFYELEVCDTCFSSFHDLRNLSVGAKAETASGKRVTYLDTKTKRELIKLLNGTETNAQV